MVSTTPHTLQQFNSHAWDTDASWLKYKENLQFPIGREDDEKLLRKFKRKYYERNIAPLPEDKPERPAAPIHITTEEQFNTYINKDEYSLVDFYADWCGPCKFIAPTFEQLAKDYPKVNFLKVDVDNNRPVASKCGIVSMPTFHLYKGGKKIDEVVGASVPALKSLLQRT